MWQYRKVYARWCMPSPRAPTTAPDAPPLHLYSTSDPADSVPTHLSDDPAEPTLPHPALLLSAAAQPAVAIPVAAQPAVAVPTAAKPAITTPSDADTDHSDDAEF